MKQFFRSLGKFFVNLFRIDTLQERRFKAEYTLLRVKFIADHHSNIIIGEDDSIEFTNGYPRNTYDEVRRNVLNLLNPKDPKRIRVDTDTKFKLVNIAHREEITQYDSFKCDTRIKQMLIEASKLETQWRREAIGQLLNDYKNVPTSNTSIGPVKTSLYEAAFIRDVHFDNLYYKSKIAKKTVGFLNRVLITLLSIFLIYSAFLEYNFKPPRQFLLGPFSDLWIVVLFGLLGAAFSTLLNLYKGDRLKNTIIKQIDAVNLTVARLVIGASAGLIVFMILNSGLIEIIGVNEGVRTKASRFPMTLTFPMLSMIFVAGFTERFVLNFIDRLSAQAEKSEEKPVKDELPKPSANGRKPPPPPPPGNEASNKNNGDGSSQQSPNTVIVSSEPTATLSTQTNNEESTSATTETSG